MSSIARLILMFFLFLLLSACGGGGDVTSGGGSVTTSEDRDARRCLIIGDFTSPNTIRVTNTCDQAIVVRILDGGTGAPRTIQPDSSIDYPATVDAAPFVFVGFGACFAPFTPVAQGSEGFDCQ